MRYWNIKSGLTPALTPQVPKIRLFMVPWISMVLFALAICRSQAAPAEAVLASNSAPVGQPLLLQITVESSRVQPPDISVNGLDIRFAGRSSQVSISNFDMTTSTVLSYQVVGQREGEFKIPSQVFVVDGRRVKTPEMKLTITPGRSGIVGSSPGSGGGAAPARGAEPISESEVAFGELIIPSETAYVGQAIPVELRMYFNADARIRVEEMPKIESEGFTIEKFSDPKQSRVEKNGRIYDVLSFETVMTPVKAGEVEVGPARMQCTISIPRRSPRFPHVDDFFNDDFFSDPFGAFATNKTLVVESDTPKLNVEPLPLEGQPRSFSGAIGQFTLASEAKNEKVQVGEPVSLTIRIAGKGNFSRIGAPKLVGDEGWRSYPPSDSFDALDNLGITGTKTFEFAVVPERPADSTPGAEFSFFDPTDGKYKSLGSPPIAIQVEGSANEAVTPKPVTTKVVTPEENQSGSTEENRDLHEIARGGTQWNRSFAPLYTRTGFWAAQSVPLLGLLTFAFFQIRRSRGLDTDARRIAALKREHQTAVEKLKQPGLSIQEFYKIAVRAIQTDAAIILDCTPSSLGIDEVLGARKVDALTASSLRALFEKLSELSYAGGAFAKDELSAEDRAACLRDIRSYENSELV